MPMRRDNIRLRALARSGDLAAKIKLGGFYLQGVLDFPRNIKLALEYLSSPALRFRNDVAVLICSHLDILEIIEYSQVENLRKAAALDNGARIKLITLLIIRKNLQELEYWAGRNDSVLCEETRQMLQQCPDLDLGRALFSIAEKHDIPCLDIIAAEARAALNEGDYGRAEQALSLVAPDAQCMPHAVYDVIAKMVTVADESGRKLEKIPPALIEASREHSTATNDRNACYLLGRMLAGLKTEFIGASHPARSVNLRKAIALLLKAADNGRAQAWMDLFHLCSDYRSSVGNPSMARFFLEKAAASGIAEAKRRLGALTLKEAKTIEHMEKGLSLLYESSIHGDRLANGIIKTLVLDVNGCEEEANSGIEEVQQIAPLLATRLRLARHFGLTKLEALSINPSTAIRPWGLVVERNLHIKKGNLSEPRAVPAASRKALETIRNAAMEFAPHGEIADLLEGSLRARALKQRRVFQKVNLRENLFFSQANSTQRDALRIGTRWAQHQKKFLDQALA